MTLTRDYSKDFIRPNDLEVLAGDFATVAVHAESNLLRVYDLAKKARRLGIPRQVFIDNLPTQKERATRIYDYAVTEEKYERLNRG